MLNFDPQRVQTPCIVCDEDALQHNLEVLDLVQQRTGCRILLSLKGFATFSMFPQIRQVLHGICASSPHEARLGREEFNREVHTYAPAYSDADIAELITLTDHLVFNSFRQWRKYRDRIQAAARPIQCGIRINPEYSEIEVDLYNPCASFSRLGVPRRHFEAASLDGISGLHFHTHCEQNADALEHTLAVVEERFGPWLADMEWVNFGGGHHITRADYDVDRLCRLVDAFQTRYGVQVYLEPGEAVGLNVGVLVATVLDIVENGMDIAILDTSAAAHMPDVLEMPYRPAVYQAGNPGQHAFTYRLAGLTCLAGDVIGDYSFEQQLQAGDRVIFLDMAHYSMVKSTTFNGIKLPSIALCNSRLPDVRVVREFAYEDYRNRLS
jgi:carboxynorspermidine decarboxylase